MYSYSDWNNKQGTIPVDWQPKDYVDLPWYENPDKDQGFTTPSENYDIYKERVGCLIPKFEYVGKGIFIPDDVDKIFGYVLNYFNLDDPVYAFAKYTPGLILPWHRDHLFKITQERPDVKREKIVRANIFLEDWKIGHILQIEQEVISHWQKGTGYIWSNNVYHLSGNLGLEDKYTLQVSGLLLD